MERLDDARLDTLLLATPISWTLQHHVGRLHRLHDGGRAAQVYTVQQRLPASSAQPAGYSALVMAPNYGQERALKSGRHHVVRMLYEWARFRTNLEIYEIAESASC